MKLLTLGEKELEQLREQIVLVLADYGPSALRVTGVQQEIARRITNNLVVIAKRRNARARS